MPFSLSHPSRDDEATVSTVGMAANNVKKGDGYICSGTLANARELGTARADLAQPRLQAASGGEVYGHHPVSTLRYRISLVSTRHVLSRQDHIVGRGAGRI